jgi:hypothetical protein
MHEALKKGDISAFNQYMQQGVSLLVGSGNYVFHGSNTLLQSEIGYKPLSNL